MSERAPIRRSTVALVVLFIAAAAAYVLVRPEPTPPVVYVPAAPRSTPATPPAIPGVTTTTLVPHG